MSVSFGVATTRERVCSICHEPTVQYDPVTEETFPVTRLTCGHSFHQTCLNRWFVEGHTTCPNCRAEVDRRLIPAEAYVATLFTPEVFSADKLLRLRQRVLDELIQYGGDASFSDVGDDAVYSILIPDDWEGFNRQLNEEAFDFFFDISEDNMISLDVSHDDGFIQNLQHVNFQVNIATEAEFRSEVWNDPARWEPIVQEVLRRLRDIIAQLHGRTQ
jgi:hypothetical protein